MLYQPHQRLNGYFEKQCSKDFINGHPSILWVKDQQQSFLLIFFRYFGCYQVMQQLKTWNSRCWCCCLRQDSNPDVSDLRPLAVASHSFQGSASHLLLTLPLLVAKSLRYLATTTVRTTVVTSYNTKNIYFQWSNCGMASLSCYQDHLFDFIVIEGWRVAVQA